MRLIDADKLIAGGWHLERHGIAGRCLSTMSLADVPTASGWISTKERLPDTDICVLAVVNGTYGNITFVDAIQIAEHFERNDADTCEDFKNEADYIERTNLLDGISSTEFGLNEIVDELIYKHNLDFLHDNDEDAVREFARDLIDCIKNYIKTQ